MLEESSGNGKLLPFILNLPNKKENPLSYAWLCETQERNTVLMECGQGNDPKFHIHKFGNVKLVCKENVGSKDWKIFLINEAVDHDIAWFHQILNYLGKQQLLNRMS